MKSMTGYGIGKSQSSLSQIEISLRSVNGRFLETRFHLPREFVGLDNDLKKVIEAHFERGTLDVFVSRKLKPTAASTNVTVNKELAKKYYQAYTQLAKELKVKSLINVETIARLPDVIKIEDGGELPATEKKSLMAALDKACVACVTERKREGKSVKENLEEILTSLENEVVEITSVREEANQNLMQRFEQKIKAKLSGVELDSARISQEVVIQLEKSDINEEITRLKEHMKNYRHLISETGSKGKKLDFYTQELLREVNTIGSKSSVSKLTQIVVQAKTLIERLREQVQNVE